MISGMQNLYFDTLCDLVGWTYDADLHAPLVPKVPLPRAAARRLAQHRRKLLVCHDMMGGYTAEDRSVDGGSAETGFTLHATAAVDIFVYFSHHRITVPPVQWTNLAHRNGALSLGTIIFEWKEAVPDLMRFMYGEPGVALLSEPADKPRSLPPLDFTVCDRIVALTEALQLDGWLLNIEVPLPGGPAQARDLAVLVGYLTTALHRSRTTSPHRPVLIWYDAVTADNGHLAWQDGVTPRNARFLDVASAVFTNYTWTPDHLQTTTAGAAAVPSVQARRHEVFTGIDVFGRNMHGGGGADGTHVAQRCITAAGTSTALFAPGWVYENAPQRDAWMDVEAALWAPFLEAFDNPDNGHWVADDEGQFNTYFSTAFGSLFALDGEIRSTRPWVNHSLQTPLPLSLFTDRNHVRLDTSAAYFGGSCLTLASDFALRLPFVPAQLHDDTIGWIVYRPINESSSVDVTMTVSIFDRELGGTRKLHTSTVDSSPVQLKHGWQLARLPLREAGAQCSLLEITICATGDVRLGQLALHRPSLAAAPIEFIDLPSRQDFALLSAQFPPGTPALVVSRKTGELERVVVQDVGDAVEGDSELSIEWHPFWKSLSY
ncbi:hypothetical protein H9P43_009806 [Blastocladiella emersonii ATCC 22665]|nr:hypothetical protein H9P43_009806 [Blastocladiella emersonii ATCC 22665]